MAKTEGPAVDSFSNNLGSVELGDILLKKETTVSLPPRAGRNT